MNLHDNSITLEYQNLNMSPKNLVLNMYLSSIVISSELLEYETYTYTYMDVDILAVVVIKQVFCTTVFTPNRLLAGIFVYVDVTNIGQARDSCNE